MTKLIDKIMPYKVIAEDYLLKIDENLDIKMKGFTKRFFKKEGLTRYLERKMNKGIFEEDYVQEYRTYHVFPGKLAIAKADAGI